MPHLPRSLPPSLGIRPELSGPPVAAHRPLPQPQPSTVNADGGPKPARLSMTLPKINPHTYQPDITRIAKQLFGKGVNVDEDTGELVLREHDHGGAAPRHGAGRPGG